MFGSMKRCARCHAAILASELVMRARDLVFHVRCFSCAACAVPLTKGDHFGMRDGAVLCRLHYEMGAELHPSQSPPVPVYPPGPHYPGQPFPSPEFLHHHHHHPSHPPHPHHSMHPQHPHSHVSPVPLQPSTPSAPDAGSPPKVPYFNGAAVVPPPRQKGRPRKRKPKDLEAMTANIGGWFMAASGCSRKPPMVYESPQGTVGMFGAVELYAESVVSRFPGKHGGREALAWSARWRVWFQNARAKWRRMVLKQEGKSDKCDGSVDGGSLGDLELYGNSTGSGGPPMSPPFMLGGPHSPASLASLDCA
ncbi:Protein apterous [Eufriesea mexicana]|uniref:Protein apterous n=2 Tax=Eufriesea mexicana TaxID=516756 RepID=A0A310SMK8_9HYME|nr:Protein apterous [Eufriesea mexicana]